MDLITLLEQDNQATETTRMSLLEGRPFEPELVTPLGMAHLLLRAAEDPHHFGVHFVRDNGDEEYLSYERLLNRARQRAAALRAEGFAPGDKAILLMRDNTEFIVSLWGVIIAGMVPVPLAYPTNFQQSNSAMLKLQRVSAQLVNPLILSDKQALSAGDDPVKLIGSKCVLLDAAELNAAGDGIEPHLPASVNDIVFIQFSSGSTGDPKGVALTHRNIILNLESMLIGTRLTVHDRYLSWMPYYHDMGIVGFHFAPTAAAAQQINMSPFRFVRRPTSWLDESHEHRATVTGAPNFGYKHLLEKVTEADLRHWDLSCLRMIFHGAEPISTDVMTEFMKKLAVSNLPASSMFPVYGMAEAGIGVTFPPLQELPRVRSIQRSLLVKERIVRHCSSESRDAMRTVDVGSPIPGMSLRVVSDNDELVREGVVGHIQLKGGNITSGYWENAEVTQRSFCDGWLRTGDLGCVLDGRVSITGRAKDIIFIRGQNFFAYDLEQTISENVGIALSRLVAVGFHDHEIGQERVALFIEKRKASEGIDDEGYRRIWQLVSEVFGIPLDYMVNIKSIPKTTSGKVRRFLLAEELCAGAYANDTIDVARLFGAQVSPCRTDDDTPTEALVRRVWIETLGNTSLETVPKSTGFRAVGGTSIKAVQMLDRLERTLHRSFTQDILLKTASIEELAAAIDKELNEQPVARAAAPRLESVAIDDDVAIIGVHGILPDASDMHQFWQSLLVGHSASRDLSTVERFQHYGWEPGDYWAALAEDMNEFDPSFLESPRRRLVS